MIRLLLGAAGSSAVFLVAAAQVPNHARIPVSAVVPGATVTQRFGCTPVVLEPFDPNCASRHFHTGIDLAAPEGTKVYSATGGIASTGLATDGCGLFVAVAPERDERVVYCHLSVRRVADGESVSAGDLIGLVGATGLATGPHVHLQVDVDGLPVDPEVFLARP
jgi:murein DD-endopeptidase MepM/ murein hydrolase activator NlpD